MAAGHDRLVRDLARRSSPGAGGQSAIYYLTFNGATGIPSTPARISVATASQQLFPDLSVDAGTVHALWWDSRNDVNNDVTTYRQRPVGNDAAGNTGPALDVYAATRPVSGGSWTTATRMSDVTTNPNYEQFGGRTVSFAGDYLWIDSKGGVTYGVWTDWRDTVGGVDQRETTQDELGADACQCRTPLPDGSFTGDTCPRAGGLDQNIYGDFAPWTARRRCVTHAPRTARRSLRIGPSDTRSGWRAPSDPQQGFARMRGRRTHDRRRPRVRAEPTTRPL